MLRANQHSEEIRVIDLARSVRAHLRAIVIGTVVAAGVASLLATAMSLLARPIRVATVLFTPSFSSAIHNTYPDDSSLAAGDFLDAPVVDRVLGASEPARQCSVRVPESLQAVVQPAPVNSRRPYFRLTLKVDPACAPLNDAVAAELLEAVLVEWSVRHIHLMLERKGGLPAAASIGESSELSLAERADSLSLNLSTLGDWLTLLQQIPDVERVQIADGKRLPEILLAVNDVRYRRLPILLATSGAALGDDSVRAISLWLQTALTELRVAERSRDDLLRALQASQNHSDRLTDELLEASDVVASRRATVEKYRLWLAPLVPAGAAPSVAEVQTEFVAIITEARRLAVLVSAFQDELMTRAAAGEVRLYRVETPVTSQVARPVAARTLVVAVVAAVLLTLFVLTFGASAWPESIAVLEERFIRRSVR